MSYNNYLGFVTKQKYLELKDKSNKELCILENGSFDEDNQYFNCNKITGYVQIHDFGKNCDFKIDKLKSRFFTNPMSFEEDEEFSIGSKELLEYIIGYYKSKVIDYYKNLENYEYEELKKEIHSKWIEWALVSPFDLNINNPKIVSSWKYEYAVFELVRIYKTFDWENNILIYSGH